MSIDHNSNNQATMFLEVWKNHIKGWEQSNLTKADYCRKEGIVYHRFLYWIKKLKTKTTNQCSPIKFLQVTNSDSGGFLSNSEFQSCSRDDCSLRIKLKDIYVEIGDNFSPISLAKVLQVLRSI